MGKRIRLLALLGCTLVLAGCEQQTSWHAREVTGLMPPLDFKLTSETGEVVTEAAFAGQVVVMFFGYTHCPDYCPATLTRLGQALQLLPEKRRHEVEVLFVSVDPQRDSPERLRRYTSFFGPQVTGLTGTMEQLRALTRRYRTTFSYGKPDAQGRYRVFHGLAVYIFDRSGRLRLLVTDNLPPRKLAADLKQLLVQ